MISRSIVVIMRSMVLVLAFGARCCKGVDAKKVVV